MNFSRISTWRLIAGTYRILQMFYITLPLLDTVSVLHKAVSHTYTPLSGVWELSTASHFHNHLVCCAVECFNVKCGKLYFILVKNFIFVFMRLNLFSCFIGHLAFLFWEMPINILYSYFFFFLSLLYWFPG